MENFSSFCVTVKIYGGYSFGEEKAKRCSQLMVLTPGHTL